MTGPSDEDLIAIERDHDYDPFRDWTPEQAQWYAEPRIPAPTEHDFPRFDAQLKMLRAGKLPDQ